MVISQTPYRVSFAGGGTDLPAFYRREFGAVLSTTIDQHMYVTIHRRFEPSIRISYSKTETAETIDEIQHDLVREAMRLHRDRRTARDHDDRRRARGDRDGLQQQPDRRPAQRPVSPTAARSSAASTWRSWPAGSRSTSSRSRSGARTSTRRSSAGSTTSASTPTTRWTSSPCRAEPRPWTSWSGARCCSTRARRETPTRSSSSSRVGPRTGCPCFARCATWPTRCVAPWPAPATSTPSRPAARGLGTEAVARLRHQLPADRRVVRGRPAQRCPGRQAPGGRWRRFPAPDGPPLAAPGDPRGAGAAPRAAVPDRAARQPEHLHPELMQGRRRERTMAGARPRRSSWRRAWGPGSGP